MTNIRRDDSIYLFELALRKLNELTSLSEPSERDEIRRQYVMDRLGKPSADLPDASSHVNTSLINEWALLYKVHNRLDEAIECHNRALESAIEAGDLLVQAASYNNLGLIFFERKQYIKALEHFNQARRTYDTFQVAENTSYDLVQYAFIQRYKGETLSKVMSCPEGMGMEFLGQEDFITLLSLKRELNDQFGEARVLNLFGDYYLQKGNYCHGSEHSSSCHIPKSAFEAYSWAKECLKSFSPQNSLDTTRKLIELSRSDIGLAEIFIQKRRFNQAKIELKEALSLLNKGTGSNHIEYEYLVKKARRLLVKVFGIILLLFIVYSGLLFFEWVSDNFVLVRRTLVKVFGIILLLFIVYSGLLFFEWVLDNFVLVKRTVYTIGWLLLVLKLMPRIFKIRAVRLALGSFLILVITSVIMMLLIW